MNESAILRAMMDRRCCEGGKTGCDVARSVGVLACHAVQPKGLHPGQRRLHTSYLRSVQTMPLRRQLNGRFVFPDGKYVVWKNWR